MDNKSFIINGLQETSGLHERAQSNKKAGQVGTVLVANGGEFKPHAVAIFSVADDGFGANLAIGSQEVEIGASADFLDPGSLDEDTAEAEIADARHVVIASGVPKNIDALSSFDTSGEAAGRGRDVLKFGFFHVPCQNTEFPCLLAR